MPLTAVGKIFKPQLRQDAVVHCVRDVMAALGGCEGVDAEVREAGGALRVVLRRREPARAARLEEIRDALERYVFKVDVEAI